MFVNRATKEGEMGESSGGRNHTPTKQSDGEQETERDGVRHTERRHFLSAVKLAQ